MLSFLLATTKTMLVLTPASNAVSAFGLPIIQQYSASGMITIGKVPRFIDSRLLATSSNRDEELRAPNIELLHDDFSEFLDKKNLRLALKDSPLFDGLSNVDIERIVQVSDVVEVSTGEDLFHEGEEGDSLYVVRSGRFEAYRKADDEKGENAKCLMVYEKGDVLGELSMLFDKSRSAAVRSTGNDQLCNLWKIKKDDYVAVLESSKMKDSVMTSIQQDPLYSGYMEDQQMRYSVLRCPLFKGLEKDDLERVLRCFVKKSMKDGQNIITQGDEGDAMYFVQSGECICVNAKTGDVLATVTEGGYFGELALLFSQKRAASVTATGDNCVVWKISKDDFLETVQESPLYDKSLSLLKTKYQSNTLWGIIKRCTFGELYSLAKTSNRPKKKNVSYHSIVSTMTTAVFASAFLPQFAPRFRDDVFGLPQLFNVFTLSDAVINQFRLSGGLFALCATLGILRIPKNAPSCRKRIFEASAWTVFSFWLVGDSNLTGLTHNFTVDAWSWAGRLTLGVCMLGTLVSNCRLLDQAICGSNEGRDTIPLMGNRWSAALAAAAMQVLYFSIFFPALVMFASKQRFALLAAPFYATVKEFLLLAGITGSAFVAFASLSMTLKFERKITEAQGALFNLVLAIMLLYDSTKFGFLTFSDSAIQGAAFSNMHSFLGGLMRQYNYPTIWYGPFALVGLNSLRKYFLALKNEKRTISAV